MEKEGRADRVQHPSRRDAGDARTWGLPTNGPHPNAARLFLDWYLSDLGQKAMADNLYLHSLKQGAAPPPGGEPLDKIKLLLPDDWEAFLKSRTEFAKEWDKYTGLR